MASAAVVQSGDGVSELQLRLAEKCSEAAELGAAILDARLQIQSVHIQLQAVGVSDQGVVPSKLQAGSGGLDLHQFELRSLLEWLVDGANLAHQVIFECGNGQGEVLVGGRRVLLHRMATWQLAPRPGTWKLQDNGSGLKLSVPVELQAEIVGLLIAARSRGRVSEEDLRSMSSWDMIGAEVVSSTMGAPEPAIFLVHRKTAQAIVIAQWPSVDFACRGTVGARTLPFDPAQHFGRAFAPPASEVPEGLASTETRRASVSMGDRVEVEFEGQWFSGVLQWVDGDTANVKCDVDSPGVITFAPLTSVRPAKTSLDEQPILSRHMRARSVG
mmetsp:Transcript_755/g.1807  ORF Transcript_755/g.1807 Transcript_755/m.1807 type:complete len:329 (-) Transcript_755:539-1525(-)